MPMIADMLIVIMEENFKLFKIVFGPLPVQMLISKLHDRSNFTSNK